MHEVKQKVEEKIKELTKDGIEMENLKSLGELVDIHKDIANEQYWDIKKEVYNNELSRIWSRLRRRWLWS